jgi:hypothetical protein
MSNGESRGWEQQLRDAAARAEEELRRVLTYINDEVVPEVRHNGSEALRAAAPSCRSWHSVWTIAAPRPQEQRPGTG